MNLSDLGRTLLALGGGAVALGRLLLVAGRVPFLGRLPGDINVRRGNASFFFPILTCVVVSVALTVLLNLALWLFRRQ